MDEHEGISRRDALIGVSFLTVLMTALMATMAYRIVDAQPRKGPARSPAIVAFQGDPAADSSPASEPDWPATLADASINAQSAPASDAQLRVDDEVQAASAVDPAEGASAPEKAPPYFVAPAGR